MSTDFFIRLLGMVIFATLGGYWGGLLGRQFDAPQELYGLVVGLLGALVGLVLTPFITTRPIRFFRSFLTRISIQTFSAGLIGLIIGLIIATLLASPLSMLPSPFGQFMPIINALFLGYMGVAVFVMRENDIYSVLGAVIPSRVKGVSQNPLDSDRVILLDTSVIIDGRIADIARTGFLPGTLMIPNFVLNELQYIADSTDTLRRQRGRRGLDVLTELQKDPLVSVRISDVDIDDAHGVDDKLVILAKQLRCPVLTNDYNLNKVADLQGVMILNVNELANAVKAVVLPGEPLTVDIIQEGKEHRQGVGYLEDGTMIVVESGSEYLGQRIDTVVTKVLQTAAGRMVFARPENNDQYD